MRRASKTNYRDQIRAALSQTGWEIVQIDDDTDWWVDQHWTISSIAQEFGYTLVMSFLVDPMHEDKKKTADVWAILVGKTQPRDRLDEEHKVAGMCMMKGQFAEKLDEFIREINRHRDSLNQ